LKVIDKEHIQRQDKLHEVFVEKNVLQFLNHPSIVKMHSSFTDKSKLYFLLDKVPNSTLHDYINRHYRLSPELTKAYISEIVASLDYMRTKEIAHRDLKPGNILLDENYHLVLCDFGTAKVNN
jgi:serine/threonine protein kinase